jgi:mannose-1-phosphate guanylyltransferase
MSAHRHAVVMAGGSGTRLWPMSRAALPKQLLPMKDGHSLLKLAYERLEGIVDIDRRCICASRAHEQAIRAELPHLPTHGFLGEPMGRDTLNAVGFAATVVAAQDPEGVMAVLTADHLIEPVGILRERMSEAFALVEQDRRRIVTFGITPTYPATGFGYVESGDPVPGASHARFARRFAEKPSIEAARSFLAAGTFSWNSGMFVFSARTALEAIARYQPECAAGLARIGAAWGTDAAARTVDAVYPTLPRISVDKALMEPASADPTYSICVVPLPVEWLDIGSWPAFASTLAPDASGNRTNARAVHIDSHSVTCVSDDPDHVIATIGCEGLVIVRTRDATLVCPAALAERVKEIAGLVPPDVR